MTSPNDADLLLSRRAAEGDHSAFALLVETHERALRSFLARAYGIQDCDDIAQEAFLKAWRFAGSYDGRARYATWLTRIACRCATDRLRANRSPAPEPDAHARIGDAGIQVDQLLAGLTLSERTALVLCEGHGWTHAEASGLLEIPLGTLKSIISRAKAKCRARALGDDDA